MRFRFGLLLALMLPFHVTANDPLDWSELQLLYAADLAIDARFVRQDDAHVWVKVAVVLRDRGFGIRAGDAIRVDKAASYDCGYPWNIGDQRRWRLYLQKEEGQGHWALSRHSGGSAIHFIHDRAIMHMPAWVELPIAEFDRCMIEFQTCYASSDSGNTFTARCAQARIDSLAAHNAILAQFEKQGRTVGGEHLFAEPVLAVEQVPEQGAEQEPPLSFVEEMPVFPGGDVAMIGFLQRTVRYPLVDRENGVQGRVYVGFVVEEDGSLSDVGVVRGVTPGMDKEAVRAITAMPPWTPGRIRGKPVRVRMVVPITFMLR